MARIFSIDAYHRGVSPGNEFPVGSMRASSHCISFAIRRSSEQGDGHFPDAIFILSGLAALAMVKTPARHGHAGTRPVPITEISTRVDHFELRPISGSRAFHLRRTR